MKLRSSETETGKFFQLEANGNLKGTITLSGQGTRSGDAKIKVECKFTADYANDGESPNDVDILNKTFEVDGRIDENGQLHNVGGTNGTTDYIEFRIMSHDDLTNSKEWVVNDDGIYEKVDENSDKIYAIDGTFNGENLTKYELEGIFKISALEDDIELSCDDFSCKITPSVDVAINEIIDLSTCTTIYSNSTKNTNATISGSFNFKGDIANLDGSSQNKLSVSVVDTIKADMGNGTVTTLEIVNPNNIVINYEIGADKSSIVQQKSTIFEIKGGSLSGRVVVDITGTIKDPKIICNVQVWDKSSCGEIYANVVQSWGENDTDEVKNKFKFENFVELYSNGEIIDKLKHGLKSISSLIFKDEKIDESTGEVKDVLTGHFCFTYYTEAHEKWVIDLSTSSCNDVQIKNGLSSDNKQTIEVVLSNDEFYHPGGDVTVNGEKITLSSHEYGKNVLRPRFNFNLSSIEKGTTDDVVIDWSIDCVDTPRGVYSTQAFSIGNIVQKNIGAFEGVGVFYLNSHYSKILSKSGSNHYDIYDIPFSVKPMINETTAHSSTHDFTVNWSGNLILDKDGKLYHDKITINESWETDNSGEALCLSGIVEYIKQTYVPSLKIYNTNKISLNQTVDLTGDVDYDNDYSGKFDKVTLGVDVQGYVYDNVVAKITKTVINNNGEKVLDEVEYREVKIEEGTIKSGTIPAKLEIKNIYLNYQNNNDTEYNELDGKIKNISFQFQKNGSLNHAKYEYDLNGRVGKKLGLGEPIFQGKKNEIEEGTEITYNWWQLAGLQGDNLIIDNVKISGTVKLRVDKIDETTNSIKLSLINSNTTFNGDDTKTISGAIQGTIYASFDDDGNITQSQYIELNDYHTEIKNEAQIGQKNYKLSGKIKLQGTKNRLKLVGEDFNIQVAEWAQQMIGNFMIKYSPVVAQDKEDFNYSDNAQGGSKWQLIYIDDEPHNYTNNEGGDIKVQMTTWKNFWGQPKDWTKITLKLETLTTSYLGTKITLNPESPIIIDAANIVIDEENNKITISNFNDYLTQKQNILWESGQTICNDYEDEDVKIKSKIKAEIEEGSENEIVLNLTDKKIEKLIFKCGNFSNTRQCSITTVINNNIKDESGKTTYGFDLININNPTADTLYYYLSTNKHLCNWYADIKPNHYLDGVNEYSLFQVCAQCTNLINVKADLSGVAVATNAFMGCTNLTKFDAPLKNLNWATSMFLGCSNLTTFNSDLSSLIIGSDMFYGCSNLKTFDVSLKNLKDGTKMFYDCSNLTSFETDLSKLDHGEYMFMGCTSLKTVKADLHSLTDGTSMFQNCSNLSTFYGDLNSLTNGDAMFYDCTALISFDVSLKNLKIGNLMFDGCISLETFDSDLSSMEDKYVWEEYGETYSTDNINMFKRCTALKTFKADLSSITRGYQSTSATTGMFRDFSSLETFSGKLSSLINGQYMFSGCTSLTDFTSDLGSLTNGNRMFWNCNLNADSVQNIALTINKNTSNAAFHIGIDTEIKEKPQVKKDLGLIIYKGWKLFVNGTTAATASDYPPPTYAGYKTLEEIENSKYSNYRTEGIVDGVWTEHLPDLENGTQMFYKCTALETFTSDLSSLENGIYMFAECSNLTSFNSDLSSLKYGKRMFEFCTAFTTLDSDLSSLTNGENMFWNCSNLTTFDSDLSSLRNGNYMFGWCSALTSFNSDLSSLTNGKHMFWGCSNLTTFDSDLSSLKYSQSMFQQCYNLTTFNADLSSLESGQEMFITCPNLTSFNSDLTSLTNGQNMFSGCKLNADSINKILNSIPQVTQTALLHLGINNTDEAKDAINNKLGFIPTTTETQATYKGWTIYVKINI